jgi:hypothetical protein
LEVLEEVFFISQERGSPSAALNIAAVVSPDFAGVRYFAPGGKETGEELQEFAGFYQRNYSGPEGEQVTYALAIRPDGQGVFGRSGGKGKAGTQTLRFSLPPLPEGFVYTGLGMVGTALIAPWEERQEGSTGAAGFMALRAPFFP